MLATSLLVLSLVTGPQASLPAGTSGELLATAIKLDAALTSGNFSEADALASRLPRRSITLSVDFSGVRAAEMEGFRTAIADAVAAWKESLPEVIITLGKRGDVALSFSPALPIPADGSIPAGAVFFVSDSPEETRVEAIIGLEREIPPQSIGPIDVRNEVIHAIGTYLGLMKAPKLGSAMGRTNGLSFLPIRVGAGDRRLALAILEFCDRMRVATKARAPVGLGIPGLAVAETEFSAPSVAQGDALTFTVEVANLGTAPLDLNAVPDCGCITIQAPLQLAAGQSGIVKVYVATQDVPGPFDKGVHLFTNDPDRPEVVLRFRSKVRPAYRFVRPDGDGPVYLGPEGTRVEFLLLYDKEKPFNVLAQQANGPAASVAVEPWSGEVADPEFDDPTSPRVGYRVTVDYAGASPTGRVTSAVMLKTDSPLFPLMILNLDIQSGIAAVPSNLYFGNLARNDRQGAFLVSRPGRPFKVTKVESASSHVEVEVRRFREKGDFRVLVRILASAPGGMFSSEVIVYTDDPAQPKIVVPIVAIVP